MKNDKKSLMGDINSRISSCTACSLNTTKKNIVPGEGNLDSPVMFIGEAPGADEDEQGRPFVGRAGQLLTKIIKSVGLNREDVFITNVVKCRPPANRKPTSSEIKSSMPILESQIAVINPKIIVAVGATATNALLGEIIGEETITKIRGKFFDWKGIRVMPILHPSYLLRNPTTAEGKPKWLTWQDMLLLKKEYDKLK